MTVSSGFEEFVRRGSTRLLRAAFLLTGDRSEAEDLLQMTLMRVLRHWRTAEQAPGPYATRVLVNLSRDRARRARRHGAEAAWEETAAIPAGPADLGDQIARRSQIMAALAQLPERQREVLVLRFYGDLSVAETAAATGASEGTVKSHTSRALARMRDLLGEPRPMEVSSDER
jgi:RNA polymerase sigma-70 factor (sigma-E family)